MSAEKENTNQDKPAKTESSLVQIWKCTLDFISGIMRELELGNFLAALLRLCICFLVLLAAIEFAVIVGIHGGDTSEKISLIWNIALLMCGVFLIVLIIAVKRSPQDWNLAKGQESRAQRIKPTPITS